MMKIAIFICLVVANLLCCIVNAIQWREGKFSILLCVVTVLNPTAATLCLAVLIKDLT